MIQTNDITVGLTVRYLNGFGEKRPLGIVSEVDRQNGHFKVTVADRSMAFWSNPTSLHHSLSGVAACAMEVVPTDEFMEYVTSLEQRHLESEKAASEALEAQMKRLRNENAEWRAKMEALSALIPR